MVILLREMREKRNINQAELARRSGVPQPQISMIENGVVPNPTGETLFKLAKALRCLMDDLIQDDNASHDPSA